MTWTLNWTTRWNKPWTTGFIARPQGLPVTGGLRLWLDAAATSTITQVAGAVSAWADKSGNGNNATQGTGSKQPTLTPNQQNGLPAIVFDGTDTLVLPSALYSLTNGANTGFFVSKRASEDGTEDTILTMSEGGSGNTRYTMSFQTISGSLAFKSNASVGAVTNMGNTNTNFQIMAALRNGTLQSLAVNGGTAATNTNGANEPGVDAAYIGSNTDAANYLIGSIAEIILYNVALSATEVTAVVNYLKSKWGIA